MPSGRLAAWPWSEAATSGRSSASASVYALQRWIPPRRPPSAILRAAAPSGMKSTVAGPTPSRLIAPLCQLPARAPEDLGELERLGRRRRLGCGAGPRRDVGQGAHLAEL